MTDRTVVYRIQADVKQAQAQMAALGASVKKSADDMTAGTKEGAKFRAGITDLGNSAGKVGLVAAVGLGAAVKKAADFDQAMSNVQAATHETAANMDALREAALKAGADTAFSATEAAAGIEELSKAGVSTTDVLSGGLAGALDLAAAGGIGVAEAAETAATALTQFGLAGEDIPHVADLLAAGAGKAQGSVSDMGMALKQSGLVAAQTGLTLEETVGTLAQFASAGLIGSDAGTSFKTMLQALTPSSQEAADTMASLGISAYDAQGNFIGMEQFAGNLRASLQDLTVEQQNATLKTIFGSDAVRAAAIIFKDGAEGSREWAAGVDDAGYAAETAATRLDNLKGDLEALGGSLETALIGTGDGSQGMLRGLTQDLTSVVNAYNSLGEGAKSGVGIALAATATLGGGLFVFSKVVQGVAATRGAMDSLGISSDATKGKLALLGKAGFGLAGLAAAGLAIDALREALEESLPSTSELTGNLLELSDGKIASLGAEFDTLASSIDRLADPGYIYESSDAILGLLTLGQVDGAEVDGARQEIDALDAALSNLATTGGSDVATKAFEDLAAAQGLTSAETKTLLTLLPGYKDALAANENQATLTGAATGDMAAATVDLSEATGRAEDAAERFTATLEGLNAVLDGRATFRDYEAAIDDFTKGLKENGKTFDINTEKGRANQAALDGIARSALDVAETLSNADRRKFLTTAISDLRTMGNSMGLPKREIDALIALLKQANQTDVKPKITADTADAQSKVASLKNSIEALRDRNLTITTVYRVVGNATDALPARASGGPIYGPGTKTSDSIPAMLSTGEYVIKAAAVDHYGLGFFDRANAMHLASGGSTDKKRRKNNLGGDDETESTTDNSVWDRRMFAMLNGAAEAAARQENAAEMALQAAEDQAQAAENNLTAAENQLTATQQLSDSFANSVASQFSGSLTGGGLAGLGRTLSQDIAGGAAFQSTLDALIASGLDTTGASAGLFQELAASGDLTTANQLLAAGPEAIAQYEAMFAQREAQNMSRGEMAAQASYGQMIAEQKATVAAAEAQVAQLQAIVAQRDAQHAQSTAQVQALTTAVQQQAEQIGNVINNTATSAAQSRPRGVSQAGSWR